MLFHINSMTTGSVLMMFPRGLVGPALSKFQMCSGGIKHSMAFDPAKMT